MSVRTDPLRAPLQVTPTGCGGVVAFDETHLYFVCGPSAADGLADTVVVSRMDGLYPEVLVANARLVHDEFHLEGDRVVFRFGAMVPAPAPQAAIELVSVQRDARNATPEATGPMPASTRSLETRARPSALPKKRLPSGLHRREEGPSRGPMAEPATAPSS